MNPYKKYILPKLLDRAMSAAEIEKIRPEVIKGASGIVLEIGFGSGLNLPFYQNVSKLYALEPSKELLEVAKARTSSISFPIEFLTTGAEHIPLPDKSMDTVVSTWTLCSVEDPEKVLKEISRVLRPGGSFVFIDHGSSPNKFIRFIQNISTPFSKHLTGNCHLNRNIEKLITNAGFDIQNLKKFHEKWKPLMYNYKGIGKLKN